MFIMMARQFLFAGLVLTTPNLASYSYLSIPLSISLLWMVAAILKGLGAGIAIALVCKAEWIGLHVV